MKPTSKHEEVPRRGRLGSDGLQLGGHVRAAADGRVVMHVRGGDGPATVTLSAARPIAPRWLGGTRARIVRFGRQELCLNPGAETTINLRLTKHHLALLRRMQTIRATVRIEAGRDSRRRRIVLHAPPKRRPARDNPD